MFCIKCNSGTDNHIHWPICSICRAILHTYCLKEDNQPMLQFAIESHKSCNGSVDLV